MRPDALQLHGDFPYNVVIQGPKPDTSWEGLKQAAKDRAYWRALAELNARQDAERAKQDAERQAMEELHNAEFNRLYAKFYPTEDGTPDEE